MIAPGEVWLMTPGWKTGHLLRPDRSVTLCGRVMPSPRASAVGMKRCGQCDTAKKETT